MENKTQKIIEVQETEQKTATINETVGTKKNNINNIDIKKLQSENEQLQKQINETQKLLLLLQSQQKNTETKISTIGCRLFNGGCLSTANGDIVYDFKCGEELDIDENDLKTIFKNHLYNNKVLFQKGMFYFTNEEDYKYYKIKQNIDLSEEHIINCLTKLNYNECIAEFAKMTNNGSDFNVKNTLLFEIATILINSPLKLHDWTYEHRANVEKYFNVKFDDLANTARYFNEKLGRM